MNRRLRTGTTPLALVLVLALPATLGGCGADEPDPNTPSGAALEKTRTPTPTPTPSPSESETPDNTVTTIQVTRANGKFSPNGETVEVPVGEEFLLVIDSDQAGELHLHSTPEQTITYEAGTSSHKITIKLPGVVEVESHDPDSVVLQLEVS